MLDIELDGSLTLDRGRRVGWVQGLGQRVGQGTGL